MLEGCTPWPDEFVSRYKRADIWASQTIHKAITDAACAGPDRLAIVDESRKLNFSELVSESRRVAAMLQQAGIQRGDRIIFQMPNCAEFATMLLGSLEIGALPVMALTAFRRAELEYLIGFSNARALAIAPTHRGFDHGGLARELASKSDSLKTIFATSEAPGCVAIDIAARQADGSVARVGTQEPDAFDVALFLLSGGTTGMPKLIPRTHADYTYNARESARVCGFDSSSRILIGLPAGHNFPLACPGLIGALLTRAAAIFTNSTKGEDLAATIVRERVTHLPCVPTIAMALTELPENTRHTMNSLRVVTVGGQKLQEPAARRLARAYPNAKVQQVFGMAEGLLCFTRLDDRDEVLFATQGRPLSDADEIRIVDEAGTDAAPAATGELWCRGPYTIRGYYLAAERNREAFSPDGFYKTGDLVRRGSGGNLVVEGRSKDLINRGGEKINAEEIEARLIGHPAVLMAAVVAMPDLILGERACAYVKLRDGYTLDLAGMRTFLEASEIARFKWPERIEIVQEMPLTNVGKIRKAELRADIARKLASEALADHVAREHSVS